MIDILVETLRALTFLVIVVLLWRRRQHFNPKVRRPLLAGFGLLLLSSLLDVSDNFTTLNSLLVTGYLLGTLLIFIGLLRLEPVSDRLQISLHELQKSRDRFRLAMEGSSGRLLGLG